MCCWLLCCCLLAVCFKKSSRLVRLSTDRSNFTCDGQTWFHVEVNRPHPPIWLTYFYLSDFVCHCVSLLLLYSISLLDPHCYWLVLLHTFAFIDSFFDNNIDCLDLCEEEESSVIQQDHIFLSTEHAPLNFGSIHHTTIQTPTERNNFLYNDTYSRR